MGKLINLLQSVKCIFVLFVCILALVHCIPKPNKGRVLKEESHYADGHHNAEYDHEAFLGQDAKVFDQLAPEESKRRLGVIVDKIDVNKDGLVSQDELKSWIEHTQKRYILEDVEKQWAAYNSANKESITWTEYKTMVYGFMDTAEVDADGLSSYKDMLRRDRRRWENADLNNDEALDKEEFTNFLHPENAPHMHEVVVTETMEDIDKDKDGKLSLSEYIGDMYAGADGEDEPDWVKNEKQQFVEYRDKNKDGFMDPEEVKQWIILPEFDHAAAEAKHLVNESDSNLDGFLSKEEILQNYDIFVGSQATDFGEALSRHDEF